MKKNILKFILPNTRAKKRIGPHNKEIIEFLIGTLLGDCSGERLKNGGVRFRLKQSIKHKDYIIYLHKYLLERGYVNNNMPYIVKDKLEDSYNFSTYSFSSWIWLYKQFYKKKRKVVPNKEILWEFFTPLSLAIWIMDDGTRHGSGLRIATHSFTKVEIELLIKFLEEKFGIKSNIHKNGKYFIIYIKKESMGIVRDITYKYFEPSMYYKLGE